MRQHIIFLDVNFKRLGGPSTHCLNGGRGNSHFS
jgi:hypothetical protein